MERFSFLRVGGYIGNFVCVCFGTTFNKINPWWQFFERCAWSMTQKSLFSLEIAVGLPVH